MTWLDNLIPQEFLANLLNAARLIISILTIRTFLFIHYEIDPFILALMPWNPRFMAPVTGLFIFVCV